LLANCYSNSFKVAVENNVKSIAFPAISTGVYRFPLEKAAKIAINEVKKFLEKNDSIEKTIFVCFDEINFKLYSELLNT
jgi:O-acetyl-ADP-ribose deacetylase